MSKVKKKDGLIYSVGPFGKVPKGPGPASTKRLNEALMTILDAWIKAERDARTSDVDVMISMMHGMNTICGTILVNLPKDIRAKAHAQMREQMLAKFDAMLTAVQDEE